MSAAIPAYSEAEWDPYVASHAQVTSGIQTQVYQAVSELVLGQVLDLGCGTGKLAPFLAGQPRVNGYLGVDNVPAMVAQAGRTLMTLGQENYAVKLADVETFSGRLFNSAVSIMSYYAWQNPAAALANIYQLVKPGGRLIIATANSRLDIRALLDNARRELIAHPNWPEFERNNLSLAENDGAHFIDMNFLVQQCQSVGFSLESCHQRFYLGGLNFVVLSR